MSDRTPLTGEPLALDLVNTETTAGSFLATPEDLRVWWTLQAHRLTEEVPEKVTAADLSAVHAVRAHTARALRHLMRGDEPLTADVEALNRAQRAAPAISELRWSGQGGAVSRRREGSAGRRLAACLAEAAAELLADLAVGRIRQCEADDCVVLFLATHPRRRWCSPDRCGNRMRVARHYRRHRA